MGARSRGFTLLEMLLVIFLMALVASAGLMLTEGVEDQAKYDETKRRMELIRKAIVGDPTRTVNGAPEISGFVADMGRLPGCLAELLELGEPRAAPSTQFKSPCNTEIDTDDPTDISKWALDSDTGLAFGWRGPYLQVLPERNGDLRFRDGYGNADDSPANDGLNSGWLWRLYKHNDASTDTATDAIILRLQSNGIDGTEPYPKGDVPLLVSSDWQVQSFNVTILNRNQTTKKPQSNSNLLLRFYLSNLTHYLDADDGINDYLLLSTESIAENDRRIESFNLNPEVGLPMGVRGYAIVCYRPEPADPDDFVLFDGDCDTGNPSPGIDTIRSINVVPRHTPNLEWDIQ